MKQKMMNRTRMLFVSIVVLALTMGMTPSAEAYSWKFWEAGFKVKSKCISRGQYLVRTVRDIATFDCRYYSKTKTYELWVLLDDDLGCRVVPTSSKRMDAGVISPAWTPLCGG